MKVECYFSTLKGANEAVEQLKSAGYKDAYVDMNDHYIFHRNIKTNLPGTTASTSLSELVLESGEQILDNDVTPLTAADPMVSGIADLEEITDYNNKVVVEIDSKDKKEVKGIIESSGGTLEDPNVKFPKGLENVNIDDIQGVDNRL